jgi:hypothetical protein
MKHDVAIENTEQFKVSTYDCIKISIAADKEHTYKKKCIIKIYDINIKTNF